MNEAYKTLTKALQSESITESSKTKLQEFLTQIKHKATKCSEFLDAKM